MRKLLYVLLCACAIACAPQKPLVSTVDTNRTEREIIHDTTVIIQPDSAQVVALLECDSANRVILRELSILQGLHIKPIVTKEPTPAGAVVLQVDCKQDSLEYEIQVRDKIIETLRSEKTEVAVPYVSDYYRNTSNGFWVLLAAMVVVVAWWGFKTFYLRQ